MTQRPNILKPAQPGAAWAGLGGLLVLFTVILCGLFLGCHP